MQTSCVPGVNMQAVLTLEDCINNAIQLNTMNRHIQLKLIWFKYKIKNNLDYIDEIEYLKNYIDCPGILVIVNNFCSI